MAKQITKYQADDGSEWKTAEEAIKRDEQIAVVAALMAPLGTRPDSCSFTNGDMGYIQHEPAVLARIKLELHELCREPLASWYAIQKEKHGREPDPTLPHAAGWYLRMLDSYGPLSDAWGRFNCIDIDGREWGQPFFVDPKNRENRCNQNRYIPESRP